MATSLSLDELLEAVAAYVTRSVDFSPGKYGAAFVLNRWRGVERQQRGLGQSVDVPVAGGP